MVIDDYVRDQMAADDEKDVDVNKATLEGMKPGMKQNHRQYANVLNPSMSLRYCVSFDQIRNFTVKSRDQSTFLAKTCTS
ncbi:MAG: hypothetical protein GY703_16480 [Gammaproteobacteria bacterium]|nr:hypothetical protein [Gammaproteobacteria bacterium]